MLKCSYCSVARQTPNLSSRLGDLGRHEVAITAMEEAVRLLAPYFLALPKAYERWMKVMVKGYQHKASELDRPSDQELLGPIVAALESLDQSGG
jgi:hypothetical protein